MADDKNAPPLAAPEGKQAPQDGAAPVTNLSKPGDSRNEDVEMKDAPAEVKKEAAEPAVQQSADGNAADDLASQTADRDVKPDPAPVSTAVSTPVDKSKAARRKSGATGNVKKKLNKKNSRAKILHLDAKPGEHYFVKLKGYPTWPVIVCSEDMLPELILKTRPVSAARADGTYRQDFAEGGKRIADRTFPVMYLQTNEFGWVSNQDLHNLDPETILDSRSDKMRRDLFDAYILASEQHPLDHYKELLVRFEQEKEETEAAKAAAAAAKKTKKTKAASPEDADMSMPDGTPDEEKKPKSRKRKAEDDDQAPHRTESAKKPKIKLTTTPKAANNDSPVKAGKEAGHKVITPKPKKGNDKREENQPPKEPVLTPEERHLRKEKEVLFLRHKLQRGLLTRDQEPKADEMVSMSEYLAKLEGFPDLEVSIIRKTKINKVLKAILKLDSIPKEEEFKFKPRSQAMLDKWNRLLAADAAVNPQAANGVNGASSAAAPEPKAKTPATNGVKKEGDEAEKPGEGSKEDEPEKADAPMADAPEENVKEEKMKEEEEQPLSGELAA